MAESIRVFLVDDHEIVRRGVADLIDTERDMHVVGEAADVAKALRIAPTLDVDVAVLDVRLPDGSGIDLCRDLLSLKPELRCLMLTAYDDDEAAKTAVLAGARGYVLKDIRGQGLTDSIRRVAQGERLITPATVQRVTATVSASVAAHHSTSADDALSTREAQVLDLIAEGLTNRQIGEQLELAEKTVKNYVSGILAKLGMERRTQAAVYASRIKDSGGTLTP